MRREAQPPTGGIYRPRNPRASPLYPCVRRHADELHVSGLITRPVAAQVLERFLACGDLHHGFARVYCDQCGHDYLLAYSCKTRYFCPSCHRIWYAVSWCSLFARGSVSLSDHYRICDPHQPWVCV